MPYTGSKNRSHFVNNVFHKPYQKNSYQEPRMYSEFSPRVHLDEISLLRLRTHKRSVLDNMESSGRLCDKGNRKQKKPVELWGPCGWVLIGAVASVLDQSGWIHVSYTYNTSL